MAQHGRHCIVRSPERDLWRASYRESCVAHFPQNDHQPLGHVHQTGTTEHRSGLLFDHKTHLKPPHVTTSLYSPNRSSVIPLSTPTPLHTPSPHVPGSLP
jgi:hypothetical protein